MKACHYFVRIVVCMIILPLSTTALFSQLNLVTNPSFLLKTLAPVPTDSNPIGMHWIVRIDSTPRFPVSVFNDPDHVTNWYRANQATPDYYNSAALPAKSPFTDTTGVKVPKIWAQGGELWGAGGTSDSAYVGILIQRGPDGFSGTPPGSRDYREYITTKLGQHLKSGKEYLVQFKYAIANIIAPGIKGIDYPEKFQYYLKRLGVAFAPDANFVEYDSVTDWQDADTHDFLLSMYVGSWNYVDIRELPYVDSNMWETFQTRFRCSDSTLQYMIIGNFDPRIGLDDIGNVPGNTKDPTGKISYEFYTFIDSVVVKEIATNSCNCTSIGIKTSKRDSLLELSNPEHCCFVSTITPSRLSCKFSAVRVSISGVPISTPAIKNFGHPVTDTEKVEVSFCVERNENETYTTSVTFEFLDADNNVICTSTDYVNCSCECGHLQTQWGKIAVLQEQVANDSGRCCWEYSVVNKSACDFLPSTASLNVYCRDSTGYERGFYTSFSPWIRSDSLGSLKFSSSLGFPHSYGTSPYITKVFKVCVSPRAVGVTPPELRINFVADSVYGEYSFCRGFKYSLACIESDNCCDKLNIELKANSYAAHGCAFDLVLSNKGSASKCDVFGVRVIDNYGDTLYALNPQDTALNLNSPKQIWYQNLGRCQYAPIPSNWGITRVYKIEILDSTGAVKCSVIDTFRCCLQQGLALKQAPEDDEPVATPLSVGGIINDATIEGNSLHYSIKNMGDDLSATIHISDLKGNVITKHKLNLTKGNSAGEFDISHLPSGTYFISVQSDLWQTSRQISIVK